MVCVLFLLIRGFDASDAVCCFSFVFLTKKEGPLITVVRFVPRNRGFSIGPVVGDGQTHSICTSTSHIELNFSTLPAFPLFLLLRCKKRHRLLFTFSISPPLRNEHFILALCSCHHAQLTPPSRPVSLSDTPTPGVGLGHGIAIAVSILVLISTIMLASYSCAHVKSSLLSSSCDDTRASVNPASDLPIVAVSGLDETSIESYPKMILGESRRPPEPNNGSSCSICLGEYRAKNVVRSITGCRHCFHAECVDAWLRINATCPLCRISQVPTPLDTPLSELVPLASHPR